VVPLHQVLDRNYLRISSLNVLRVPVVSSSCFIFIVIVNFGVKMNGINRYRKQNSLYVFFLPSSLDNCSMHYETG
jgi:hypothetical protein